MLLDLLVPAAHAAPEVGERVLCRHPFDSSKRAYVTPSRVLELHAPVFEGGGPRPISARGRASDAVDGATHASVTAIAIATRAFDRIARAWACGERTMGWGRFLD